MNTIIPGMFAKSLAGHDKGTLYLICRTEGDFVYLADGRTRPAAHPKKKNIRHIQADKTILPEIAGKLENKTGLSDADIRAAIRKKTRGGDA